MRVLIKVSNVSLLLPKNQPNHIGPLLLKPTKAKANPEGENCSIAKSTIDNANNLVFWCRFLNKLEPWYIMQQQQNTLFLT